MKIISTIDFTTAKDLVDWQRMQERDIVKVEIIPSEQFNYRIVVVYQFEDGR